jgi:hypothetical protein
MTRVGYRAGGSIFSVALLLGCSSESVGELQPPGLQSSEAVSSSSTGGTANSGATVPGTSSSGQLPPTSTGVAPSTTGGPATSSSGTSAPPSSSTTEGDPNAIPDVAPAEQFVATPRLARLSRLQWANSVRQLLRLDDIADIEHNVSGDALINFDTEADALFVTEQLRRQLEEAAEKLADRVVAEPATLAALEVANPPTDAVERARSFVTNFGFRAFRRPLTDEEVSVHLDLFDQGPTFYPELDQFAAGASMVIQALLQSPHFLYRTELGVAAGASETVALNDFEIASKLAFALTNTMPSDELLAEAQAGGLRDKATIATRAGELLDGPNGVDGIANFNAQVLRLGTYAGIERDPVAFPAFTPEAPAAMREEVLRFLEWAFKSGHGVKEYYTSPVGFVNSALAPLYGLTGDFEADTFTQVNFDPAQRSGLLTQAGFLSSYISDGEPDIIHRGVFIATRLLCIKLPPPDPNATSLVELEPDMTNRQRVEATTGKGTCGEGCHSLLLNPLGYAFENYDAVGQYRTTDQGLPVDASATYTLDGQTASFNNGVELSHLLAEAKQTHKCYAQNMLQYLHGRPVVDADQAIIDYYARLSRADMLSVRGLVEQMVVSDRFLKRLP